MNESEELARLEEVLADWGDEKRGGNRWMDPMERLAWNEAKRLSEERTRSRKQNGETSSNLSVPCT